MEQRGCPGAERAIGKQLRPTHAHRSPTCEWLAGTEAHARGRVDAIRRQVERHPQASIEDGLCVEQIRKRIAEGRVPAMAIGRGWIAGVGRPGDAQCG